MDERVVMVVLGGLVALRALAVAFLVYFIIRPVRACPACFRDTFPLKKRWLAVLGLAARSLEWRWCPFCGWEGPARRLRVPAPPPGTGADSPVPGPSDAHEGERAGG